MYTTVPRRVIWTSLNSCNKGACSLAQGPGNERVYYGCIMEAERELAASAWSSKSLINWASLVVPLTSIIRSCSLYQFLYNFFPLPHAFSRKLSKFKMRVEVALLLLLGA